MIGVGTFAVLIGVVTGNISSAVDGLKVSNERALEVRHTVLVNWGDYTKPILRQLEAARREGRLSGPVVVLSTKDKSEMDAEVADELSRMRPPAGLTVLTRQGSPVQLNDIDRAAAGTAKRVIMLQPSSGPKSESLPTDATGGGIAATTEGDSGTSGDVESLRQSTALLSELQASVHQKSGQRAAVVVSAPPGYRAGFTKGEGFRSYAEVCAEDYVSRVISQCAVQPGLSSIYEEILLQGKGCELYTEPLTKHKSLHGKAFGELARCFPRAVPIGVIQQTQAAEGSAAATAAAGLVDGIGGEATLLSPPDSMVLKPTDSLVLLASNKQDTRPSRPPLEWVRGGATSVGAQAQVKPSGAPSAVVSQLKPQNLLVLNVDDTMPDIISQIDTFCPPGSTITLLSPQRLASRPKLEHASFQYIEGEPTDASSLRHVDVGRFDAIVCLQPGKGSDADDSKMLVSLLSLERAAQQAALEQMRSGRATSPQPGAKGLPRIVGEVHSPSMVELLTSRWPGIKSDFMLPSELSSGILVQFALQPELRAVYTELLKAEGREILIADAAIYADTVAGEQLSFADLSMRARARGEIAIGIYRNGEKAPELNPRKNRRLTLQEGDRLVVIGEAF